MWRSDAVALPNVLKDGGPFFLHRLTLKMKRAQSFDTSLTTHPATQRLIPKGLNLQQHRCENLKSRELNQIMKKLIIGYIPGKLLTLWFRTLCHRFCYLKTPILKYMTL
jgi:hypothetical protein